MHLVLHLLRPSTPYRIVHCTGDKSSEAPDRPALTLSFIMRHAPPVIIISHQHRSSAIAIQSQPAALAQIQIIT